MGHSKKESFGPLDHLQNLVLGKVSHDNQVGTLPAFSTSLDRLDHVQKPLGVLDFSGQTSLQNFSGLFQKSLHTELRASFLAVPMAHNEIWLQSVVENEVLSNVTIYAKSFHLVECDMAIALPTVSRLRLAGRRRWPRRHTPPVFLRAAVRAAVPPHPPEGPEVLLVVLLQHGHVAEVVRTKDSTYY